MELIYNNFLTISVQILVDHTHHLVENLTSQIGSQVIIDFPYLLVIGVVVLLQPFIPEFTTSFNVGSFSLRNVQLPFTLDDTSILSINGPSNLHRLANLGL